MRLTGHELLETLNNYFSKTNDDFEFLVLLAIPILIIVILIIVLKDRKIIDDDFGKILNDEDYEFIEVIRQTKKLEEFDRDLLIELSIQSKIKPIYMSFIDKRSFLNVEADLIHNLKKSGKSLADSSKYIALRTIKKKLF